MKKNLYLVPLSALFTACSLLSQQEARPVESLSEAYSEHFTIGAAIDSNSFRTHEKVLTTHFNSVTAENEMKFESLQPIEGQFSFAIADEMMAFAEQNNMATRGHALVWHRQTPDWVFTDDHNNSASPELLRARLKNHITTVMHHFKGRVDVWDVVNEAIMDDGSLRTHQEEKTDQKSLWFGILGEDYIADAFRIARQADPTAKLYYNDYYNYLPARRDAIYNLLKRLIEAGVPIDGVGLQCHLNSVPSTDPNHQSYHQTIENLEQTIQLFASLGLDVQITELDVSVYTGGIKYNESDFITPDTFTKELQSIQAERYRSLFELFYRNSHLISNVTFWGIADDNTWLSEFDSGRQDFPMLFDVAHNPKPAFNAVLSVPQRKSIATDSAD